MVYLWLKIANLSLLQVKKYSLIKNICSKNLIFAKTNLFIVNS